MIYQIRLDIVKAVGWQLYEVEASSEGEALRKYKEGKASYILEEIDYLEVNIGEVEALLEGTEGL
jgi:hypothetical protein